MIPAISAATTIAVDRLMTDRYGVHLLQMMEHAGSHLAHLSIQRLIGPVVAGCTIIVLAGSGGNGGGALVCARHRHNRGVRVRVALTRSPDEYAGVPAHQLRIVERLGIDVSVGPPDCDTSAESGTALIVDGIVGYSLRGALTGDLYLADIGVPPEVYRDLGIDLSVPPIFVDGPIIALARSEPDECGPPRFIAYSECMESHHG